MLQAGAIVDATEVRAIVIPLNPFSDNNRIDVRRALLNSMAASAESGVKEREGEGDSRKAVRILLDRLSLTASAPDRASVTLRAARSE